MKLRSIAFAATVACLAVAPGAWAASDAPPRETIAPAFKEAIPNVPGKSLIGVVVNYPPGGKTPAHRHPRSAFITGYVLSGAIRSQVDDGEVQVFHAGQSWTEQPGAHHRVSENASATEPASLLAIFIVDSNDTDLVTLDKQ